MGFWLPPNDGGVVGVGAGPAQLVEHLQLILERLGNRVEEGHLVDHARHAALGAGAVVAHDVDDQRVVGLSQFVDRGEQAPDLLVGLLAEAREHLHLAREQPALVGGERVPVLDRGGLGGQLRVGGHDPQLLLPGERFLAVGVPAAVEAAGVLPDVGRRHVVRRVRGAGREVQEERPVRRQALLLANPGNRLVRHVGHEVVVGVGRLLDAREAIVERRRPLVGLAADEPVELVEARPRRPAIGRPRGADLPRRRFVVLPEGAGTVAVQPEDLGERGDAVRPVAGVPGKRRRDVHHRAGIGGVVIAAGLERHARRRAEGRDVEVVVAEPVGGQAVEVGHLDRAAERARLAEAEVVEENHDHVGRLGRRLHLEARRRGGLAGLERRARRIRGVRHRQHPAVDVGARARRGRRRLGRLGRSAGAHGAEREIQDPSCRARHGVNSSNKAFLRTIERLWPPDHCQK